MSPPFQFQRISPRREQQVELDEPGVDDDLPTRQWLNFEATGRKMFMIFLQGRPVSLFGIA
ncbi:hypothetical protein [Ferrovum myxofaciens]|uniref:hypothetical protein n=1 Tax=Ferrovum myxofaciens TaxID=416213 RepID=UPI003EBFA9BF